MSKRRELMSDGMKLIMRDKCPMCDVSKSAYQALEEKRRVAIEALVWADEFFTARDQMNAKVHCAPLRLSPITERVKQALAILKGEGE